MTYSGGSTLTCFFSGEWRYKLFFISVGRLPEGHEPTTVLPGILGLSTRLSILGVQSGSVFKFGLYLKERYEIHPQSIKLSKEALTNIKLQKLSMVRQGYTQECCLKLILA